MPPRKRNAQQRREEARRYRARYPEKIRALKKKWWAKHKDRLSKKRSERYHSNPEVREQQQLYRIAHREYFRRKNLVRKFGPGADEHYAKQLKVQEGKCGICNVRPARLCQDHSTRCCPYDKKKWQLRACGRCLRGLLCSNCNRMLPPVELGDWLQKAIAYLEKWKHIQ